MKNTYYFPHDINAHNDEKILVLRARHGMDGYGIFWIIVEMMHETKDGYLDPVLVAEGMSYQYKIDITLINRVITTCIDIGLFRKRKNKITSRRVQQNKKELEEYRKKKSLAGKKGMISRWKYNKAITDDNNTITKHNKGKESKEKESKVNKISIVPAKYSSIKDITEIDIEEIAEKYKVPIGFVRLQLEKMSNWSESKGKTYRNYRKGLMNWVLRDMQKQVERRINATDRVSIDTANL